MLTEDYLMRYLRIATAALAEMFGLRAAGLDQDALFLLDRTLEQLLGLRIDLIRSMASRDLFNLLAEQDRLDPALLATAGDLFGGEGDLLNRLDRPIDALACSIHSLSLYLEAWFQGAREEDMEQKIEVAITGLQDQTLPEELLFSIFSYHREKGDDGGAFGDLADLLAISGYQPDLASLAREYYTELLGKPDQDLVQADLSRAEIQQAVDNLDSRR